MLSRQRQRFCLISGERAHTSALATLLTTLTTSQSPKSTPIWPWRAQKQLERAAHAAVAYQTLMSIYSNNVGDVALSLHYADLCADAATKAGDKTQWFIALVARYSIAAEIGDRALMIDLRKQLEPLRGAEKYGERFAIVFADALYLCMEFGVRHDASVLRRCQSRSSERFAEGSVAWSSRRREPRDAATRLRRFNPRIERYRWAARSRRNRSLRRAFGCWQELWVPQYCIRANRKSEAMRMFHAYGDRTTLSIRRLMHAVIEDNYGLCARRRRILWVMA